jgi:hypothetical protein
MKKVEEVKESVNSDVELGYFSEQAILDRNLNGILALNAEGISFVKIHEMLFSHVTYGHFKNLLYRSRRKKNKPTNTYTAAVEVTNHGKKSETKEDQWIDSLKINGVNKTPALNSVILTLEEAGWSPENYEILRRQFDISNFNRLVDVVSRIKSSKFRKNIYKDGKPCF